MQLNDNDLSKLKGLKTLISRAKLELHGDAVIMAASHLLWLDKFEERAIESMKPQEPLKVKKVKEPVKKL